MYTVCPNKLHCTEFHEILLSSLEAMTYFRSTLKTQINQKQLFHNLVQY